MGNIKVHIEEMIRGCAEINSFGIEELAIQPDHIHVLLSAKPRYSPSKIMQLVKSGSSKKRREEYTELKEFLGLGRDSSLGLR